MCSISQVRTIECRQACITTLGSDSGQYFKEKCYCYDTRDYYEFTNRKRYKIGKKIIKNKSEGWYVKPHETYPFDSPIDTGNL